MRHNAVVIEHEQASRYGEREDDRAAVRLHSAETTPARRCTQPRTKRASPAYAPPVVSPQSPRANRQRPAIPLRTNHTSGKARLGGRRHERHHAKSGRLPRGENGTNMTHWGAVRNSRASARTSNLLRTRPTNDQRILRKPLLAGYAAARCTFAFVRGPRGSLTSCACRLSSCRTSTWRAKRSRVRRVRIAVTVGSGLLTQIPRLREERLGQEHSI